MCPAAWEYAQTAQSVRGCQVLQFSSNWRN